MTRGLVLLPLLLLAGCFFPSAADVAFGRDDDDSGGDDDDAAPDDDDAAPDDDDATPDDDDAVPDDDDAVADADGDGWFTPDDCDDGDAAVYPGAPEVFDLRVNDCLSPEPQEVFTAGPLSDRIAGENSQANLGDTYGIGDLNGDGLADLCVRGSGEGSPAPVYVFLGVEATMTTLAARITGDATVVLSGFDGNGSIDCSHDVNGDGRDDLVVASWEQAVAESSLRVFTRPQGWAQGTLSAGDADAQIVGTVAQQVGHCFGIGDVVGGPEIEIVVGQTTNDDIDNRLRSIGVWDGALSVEHTSIPSTGDRWAGYLCDVVPDISGGGHDELIIADNNETFLFLGEVIDAAVGTPTGATVIPSAVQSVAGVDLDGDGRNELVLGTSWWPDAAGLETGAVAVLWGTQGSASWLIPFMDNDGPLPGRGFVLDGPLEGSWFGFNTTALGDVNGDGLRELAVTAHGNDLTNYPGQVFVFAGRSRAVWDALGARVTTASADAVFNGFYAPDPGASAPFLGNTWDRWSLGWQAPSTARSPGLWVGSTFATFNSGENAGAILNWPTP